MGKPFSLHEKFSFLKLSLHRARSSIPYSVFACVSIAGRIAFRWVFGQCPALFSFVRTRTASSLAVYSSSGTPPSTASRHHSHASAHWLGRSQQEQPLSSGFIPLSSADRVSGPLQKPCTSLRHLSQLLYNRRPQVRGGRVRRLIIFVFARGGVPQTQIVLVYQSSCSPDVVTAIVMRA